MKLNSILSLALLAFIPLRASTVGIPLCNTGLNAACSSPATLGSADSHWDSRPVGGIGFLPALVLTPLGGGWLPNTADSQWIGPATGLINPAGVHRYRLDFNLPAIADLGAVTITGRWSSDNDGNSVRLNGVVVPVLALPGINDSNVWTAFTINAGNATFQTGGNTLEFRVRNRLTGGIETATGFRAEFTTAQFEEVPEPATCALFGAGLAAAGLLRRRATIRE